MLQIHRCFDPRAIAAVHAPAPPVLPRRDDAAAHRRARLAPRTPIVLLATDDAQAPAAAIARAATMARMLEAELHVLGVVEGGVRERPHLDATRELIARRIASVARTERAEVHVRTGALAASTIELGRSLAPLVVVLSPSAGGHGKVAVEIADELRTPVLVAREPRPNGPIVAATDMRDPRYPVLQASRTLARALHTPMTYVHNASPAVPTTLDPMGVPFAYLSVARLDEEVADAKLARLQRLAHEEGEDVDAVVVRSYGTVGAILEAARDRDADVVTVGRRPCSWLGRLLGRRVPERIVDRCRRSVLIVPIAREPADGPARRAPEGSA